MDERTFTHIVNLSTSIAKRSKVKLLRPLSREIVAAVQKDRSISVIAGIRGSGKTTILAELYHKEKEALFVNCEALVKYGADLLEFMRYGYARGYKCFLLDEVHAIPEWEKDVKLFYDETGAKLVISGSSALILRGKGSELSRRARFYELKPLSFREYLHFTTGTSLKKVTIREIIESRRSLTESIIPYTHYFEPYLNFDALPSAYFEKNPETYINILERTIRYDLMNIQYFHPEHIPDVYRVVKMLAISKPAEISYSTISSAVGISVKLVKKMLEALAQTGIVYLIPPSGRGSTAVRKEYKVLMPLSFRAALCVEYGVQPERGAIREDFFVQHVGACSYFKSGRRRKTPDFVVGDYIFEVGGSSKTFKQIADMKNSYLVKESITFNEKEIPIYLFGLLY